MKKFRSFLIIGCICAIIFSSIGGCLVSAANNATFAGKKISVIDLVRLKNYIAGYDVEIDNVDYNKDGNVDARDLTTLIKILLGIPLDSDIEFDLDLEGFFNQVIKP